MRDLTLALCVDLPSPWPVTADRLAAQEVAEGVVVRIGYLADGRLAAVASTTDGFIRIHTSTPQIIISGQGVVFALIMVILEKAGTIRFLVNGSDALPEGPPIVIQAGPPLNQQRPEVTTKDKAGIKAELFRRRQRAASYRKGGLSASQLEQRWEDLSRECRLLSKAIARLKSGDEDEVVNVSNHLRKVIGGGNGNHVLQDCAALDAKALLVWTRPPPDPKLWTPAQLGLATLKYQSSEPFSLEAAGMHSEQTDLDCWLARDAGVVGGKQLTNLNKLHAIADKIGAHLDIRDRETVEILQSLEFDGVSALAAYLVPLAEGVLILANGLIQEHS